MQRILVLSALLLLSVTRMPPVLLTPRHKLATPTLVFTLSENVRSNSNTFGIIQGRYIYVWVAAEAINGLATGYMGASPSTTPQLLPSTLPPGPKIVASNRGVQKLV